jgi:toxin YoeB
VIITRDRGKPAAVLMSLEEFASYEETRHLLRSPRQCGAPAPVHRRVRGGRRQGTEAGGVKLPFSDRAWEENLRWQSEDENILERLNTLIKECRRTPFKGIGKPGPLRGEFSGWWSRRITHEHRLVYRVNNGALQIAQCRYHY